MTELNNVLDAAIARLANMLAALPAVPGPPAKLLRESHRWRGDVTGGLVLKIVAFRPVAVGHEPPVLMIEEALVRISHYPPLIGRASYRERRFDATAAALLDFEISETI